MLFLTDFRLFGTLGYDAGSLEIERNGAFFNSRKCVVHYVHFGISGRTRLRHVKRTDRKQRINKSGKFNLAKKILTHITLGQVARHLEGAMNNE